MDGKPSIIRSFPRSFWTGNTMEIFERMGWYGFYTVSSLYLTGKVSEGCLGFSSKERGIIQGLITFFLYLFPAVFGTLADRYGYKKMFLLSFVVMCPTYVMLSLPTTFWAFFAVYLFLAVGHGMFKPVVLGTIAKTTDERTGTMGFGIFYMMVNIGGFVGPMIAGVVRGWDWKYVFYSSAIWMFINFFICLFLYKEPPRSEKGAGKSLKEVFRGMTAVVGNARFFIMICGIMIALVMGSKWWNFSQVAIFAGLWILVNFIYDMILKAKGKGSESFWLVQPMRVGETRYLLFLLLMAGFWVSFNQIFITLPEYIRDYADTTDLIRFFAPLGIQIQNFFQSLGFNTSEWHKAVLINGQVKPEYLINIDALAIIFLQILISWTASKWKPFTTIIVGVLITVISFFMYLIGASGWVIIFAIVVFAIGEMLASPKANEYVGRISPPEKVGMYMGYYFWCVALGNLFGGLLSGVAYQYFGPKGINRPNIMWILFAGISITTAILLAIYNKWVTKNPAIAKS